MYDFEIIFTTTSAAAAEISAAAMIASAAAAAADAAKISAADAVAKISAADAASLASLAHTVNFAFFDAAAAAKDAAAAAKDASDAMNIVAIYLDSAREAEHEAHREDAEDAVFLANLDEAYTKAEEAQIDLENILTDVKDTRRTVFEVVYAYATSTSAAAADAADEAYRLSVEAEAGSRLNAHYCKKQARIAADVAIEAYNTIYELLDDFRFFVRKYDEYGFENENKEALLRALLTATQAAADAADGHAHSTENIADAMEEAAADAAAAKVAADAAAAINPAADAAALTAWQNFMERAKGTERAEIAEKLYNTYMQTTAAKIHISIFEYDGMVYTVKTSRPIATTCKPSSREGEGYALRFIPSKAMKKALTEYSEILCTTAEFTTAAAEMPEANRGDIAEILYKKMHGYTAKKDYSAFWCGCDVTEESASMKYENASIINQKTAAAALESLKKNQ